jgi:hypothetical protein
MYAQNILYGVEIKILWRGGSVFHRLACRKKRLKWVATPPLGNINTKAWFSGMGVGRGANNLTL